MKIWYHVSHAVGTEEKINKRYREFELNEKLFKGRWSHIGGAAYELYDYPVRN